MGWKPLKKPEEVVEKVEIKEPIKEVKTSKGDRVMIVKELPLRPIKEFVGDDGITVHLFTIEEWLTMEANQD